MTPHSLSVTPNEAVMGFIILISPTTTGNVTTIKPISPCLHCRRKLDNNLVRVGVDADDWFGAFTIYSCLCRSFITCSPIDVLFCRTPLEIFNTVICLFKFSNMINLGLTLWVIIGNKCFSDQAVNRKLFTLAVFVKVNNQITITVFHWFQYSFFSPLQTLHSPPVTRLIKILITNDILPNFNIFFQFLSDVAPEPYFQSIRLGTG